MVPGASVAAIALAGGINANLLFKWRRDHLRSMRPAGTSLPSSTVLVPVDMTPGADADHSNSKLMMPPPTSTAMTVSGQRAGRAAGVIELDIAGAVLRLRGPVDESSLCSVLRALRHST